MGVSLILLRRAFTETSCHLGFPPPTWRQDDQHGVASLLKMFFTDPTLGTYLSPPEDPVRNLQEH